MSSRAVLAGLIAIALLAACSASPSASTIDPSNFVSRVDNPWLPMVPGTTFRYEGTRDGKAAVDIVEVTAETKVIDGVTCVLIRDTLTLDGVLAEKTDDWYVQDKDGNVWYFGEQTATLDTAGNVTDTAGSWQAGVNGAVPGIFMPAKPEIGQSFRQEYLAGEAEDHFVILLLDQRVEVPYRSFDKALITAEWTPLEPDVLSEKAYANGIGQIDEKDVAGGNEELHLVSVANP